MMPFDRRELLRSLAAAGTVCTVEACGMSLSPDQRGPNRDLIRAENQREGTTDWQLTYVYADPQARCRSTMIEGYVSQASARAGDKLNVYVSTNPPSNFVIDIYRLGYYQGKGGRFVTRLGPFTGTVQPTPPVGDQRMRECEWEPAATLEIPQEWISGVYLGKLSALSHRYQSYVIFIVRDDRRADFLFQCSDNTWQAYNNWPGSYSLYDNDRKDGKVHVSGVRVSFDRPYGKFPIVYDNPLSQGSGEFLLWEFPLACWMENLGYDVTYCSNTDVHSGAACPSRAKSFLSVGHDEYWSRQQYDNVLSAVKGGTNVAFLSGNTCCCVVDFFPSSSGIPNRAMSRVGRYGGIRPKEHPWFADLPVEAPNEATLIGAQTVTPFNGTGDWTVTRPDHWLFQGTGMKKGDSIPGLVGWEFHGEPWPHPGLEVIAEGPTWTHGEAKSHYTATIYPGPENNFVFNASTIWWSQGLSAPPGHAPPIWAGGRPHGPDARVQRITRNLFERFLSS